MKDEALERWLDAIGPEAGRTFASRLDEEGRAGFIARLAELGKTPDDYVWGDVLSTSDPVPEDPDDTPPLPDTGRPPPEDPDDDDGDEAAGDGGGGGCFIATVAYGDPMHRDVVFLRQYRETVLRPRVLGRAFIAAHAIGGPVLAALLRPHPRGRAAARAVLGRIVRRLSRNRIP
jgi:hypothetical protein